MKKIIISIAGFVALVACFAFYQFNKPHKNIHQVKTDYVMSSTDLFNAFADDELVSNEKYLDKVVEIRGRVEQIDSNNEGITVLLNGSEDGFGFVNCSISSNENNKISTIEIGQYILVKGVCTGYLMDVVINKCVIKKS